MHSITDEQLQLAKLIGEGLTYEEIGRRLGINPRTVKTQTDRLRWTLGVNKKRLIPQRMKELGLM